MKKYIKSKFGGAYALFSNNEYLVYNSQGVCIGVIDVFNNLNIACSLAIGIRLSYSDLKSVSDLLIQCEVEFALVLT